MASLRFHRERHWPAALACAYRFAAGSDLFEVDIEFNERHQWADGAVSGRYDVESVAVHEAGHGIGLDHTTSSGQVMYETLATNTLRRNLGSGDLAGLRTLYPGNAWYLRNTNNTGGFDITLNLGSSSDTPLVGDWDGNGTDTPGVFRPPNTWFLSNDFDTVGEITFNYGSSGDRPVVGDWDGDGDTTPGVFRGNTWLLNNAIDSAADFSFAYGRSTDTPIVGNWDGVKACGAPLQCGDTPGVVRGNSWLLNNGFDGNNLGVGDVPTFAYGNSSDTPIAGNWDNANGCPVPLRCHDTPGVFRGPNNWLLNNGFDTAAEITFAYGRRGNKLAGDWNGIGPDTIGVR